MTAPAPAIRLTGIRKSIPPGYTLGRITAGIGDVQLVRHDELAVKLAQTGQVLSPTTQQWQAGAVSALDGTELVINSTTITLANRGAGTLMGNPGTAAAKPSDITIGTGLTLSAAGTLSATGGGGSGTVTNVATGAGLSGGPITTSGTIVADWNGGTVVAVGPEFVKPSGTLHFDQMPTYISASATVDTTYFGKNLVDNSTGASDIVLTLPTLTAGTHLTFAVQNNSAHHYVRVRPATGVTINGVPTSDYLLPNFTGGAVSIDSTGTAYTTGAALSFWNPNAGYVTNLNGLTITNNGTFSTNGTLQPVVDGTSISLSAGGTLFATAGGSSVSLDNHAGSSFIAAGGLINQTGTFGTWMNQGSAAVTTFAGGPLVLHDTETTAGVSVHAYVQSVPVGSWTATACAALFGKGGLTNGTAFGLVITDGTKLVGFAAAPTALLIQKFTSTTVFSANAVSTATEVGITSPGWYRIIYDSVTPKLTYQISADGFYWQTVATESGTLFLTPASIGIGLNSQVNSLGADTGVSLFYFTIA